MDKPKREAILDLAKYVNERIRVKFTGGREGNVFPPASSITLQIYNLVTGVLKGFDQLLNLVLDDVEELLQGNLTIPLNAPPNLP
jgi:U6 snRNA-associated Sm-like protein LSm7